MGRAPGHNRHGRDCVLRGTLDKLVADSEIDESIALLIHDPEHIGMLEEN